MSDLIWIQSVWYSDDKPERIFSKILILKKISRRQKIMKNYPACHGLWYISGCYISKMSYLRQGEISYWRLLIEVMLITFANSLDPNQVRHKVRPDLGPICLTLWWHTWKNFLKILILKKICRRQKIMKNYPACHGLRFISGCYISKMSYLRQGEISLDNFYKPWHEIIYYRYLRFFSDGRYTKIYGSS